MQLRGKPVKVSGAFDNIYRDTRRKGDKPREWSWRKPKRSRCVNVNVQAYIQEQAHATKAI